MGASFVGDTENSFHGAKRAERIGQNQIFLGKDGGGENVYSTFPRERLNSAKLKISMLDACFVITHDKRGLI